MSARRALLALVLLPIAFQAEARMPVRAKPVTTASQSRIATPSSRPTPERTNPAEGRSSIGEASPHYAPSPPAVTEIEGLKELIGAVERAAETYEKQTKASPWTWPPPPLAVFAFVTACVAVGNFALVVLRRRHDQAHERPWLVAKVTKQNVISTFHGPSRVTFPYKFEVEWSVGSHGATEAPVWIVRSSKPEFRLMKLPLRGEPPYEFDPRTDDGHVLTRDSPLTGKQVLEIGPLEYGQIHAGELVPVFFGVLYYRDVAGRTYETRFCWYWEQVMYQGQGYIFQTAGGGPKWNRST